MPSMRLIALGLNHRTAPVEVRERFSLSRERIIEGLDNLQEYEPLQEAVVLSTCNRSELYVAADLQEGALEAAQNFWADLTGNKEKFILNIFQIKQIGGTKWQCVKFFL